MFKNQTWGNYTNYASIFTQNSAKLENIWVYQHTNMCKQNVLIPKMKYYFPAIRMWAAVH